MKTLLVIPARYASTRLPGKPLKKINGRSMLSRVYEIAQKATVGRDVDIVVATDHDVIADHCLFIDAPCIMTSPDLKTGSDRVAAALAQREAEIGERYDFVLNFQGDAVLTPPDFLTAMIDAFDPEHCDVVTPVVRLSWRELDALRQQKAETPFSGTTVVFREEMRGQKIYNRAMWFSKTIIPAIRNEVRLRKENIFSPVFRHIGIYGYARDFIDKFFAHPPSRYEELEGLEQLRIIEMGHFINCVEVDYVGRPQMSGVDSPEDLRRAEELIQQTEGIL